MVYLETYLLTRSLSSSGVSAANGPVPSVSSKRLPPERAHRNARASSHRKQGHDAREDRPRGRGVVAMRAPEARAALHVLNAPVTVRRREHARVDARRVRGLGERRRRVRLRLRRVRLALRRARQEHERDARRGHGDLACVGGRVACDRLDDLLADEPAVALESTTVGLQERS